MIFKKASSSCQWGSYSSWLPDWNSLLLDARPACVPEPQAPPRKVVTPSRHRKPSEGIYKNTFNEQHTYVFSASSHSNLILHKCDKKFYVSPFMEMKTFYNFRLLNPGKILNVFIKQGDSQGTLLTACQVGKKIDTKHLNYRTL